MRKEYIGPHIVTDGRLSYTSFDGGYFDPEAGTMYYITDWQGNNAAVVSAGGDIVQQTTYYPYGEPTVEPAGQPFLFGGKEREHGGGRNIHDFGARCLTPYGNWSVTDPLYEKFFPISQYSYCGGDPINRVDPDGKFWDTVWDVGNIIYDGTCAIIEHIKGNHEAAKEYWIDAAYDTGAALIPFVPAGASKVTKAAKGL
ncbi:RHS repeat domain-containing protein, partial [uncultured Muribaculum sp.]|uniref:RHS repeat domain-containing protein n=1 Tax=uncultured Muribaculum sp. TaxID=1918613 RepID=UPI0026F09D30